MDAPYTPIALLSPGDLILYPGPWCTPFLLTSADETWYGGYTLRGTYFDMKAGHFRPRESVINVPPSGFGAIVCDADYRSAFGLEAA
jgi:hypothetical protein